MKKIKLTRGKYAIVDDEDFEWLNQWKWYCSGYEYVVRSETGVKSNLRQNIFLHRILMNTPKGMETDHINGNKLDNRKSNLRICTRSQNEINKSLGINNTSGFKGVSWHKNRKKWQGKIQKKHLGYFDKKKNAIKTYNKTAKKLFGEFAYLNKI